MNFYLCWRTKDANHQHLHSYKFIKNSVQTSSLAKQIRFELCEKCIQKAKIVILPLVEVVELFSDMKNVQYGQNKCNRSKNKGVLPETDTADRVSLNNKIKTKWIVGKTYWKYCRYQQTSHCHWLSLPVFFCLFFFILFCSIVPPALRIKVLFFFLFLTFLHIHFYFFFCLFEDAAVNENGIKIIWPQKVAHIIKIPNSRRLYSYVGR